MDTAGIVITLVVIVLLVLLALFLLRMARARRSERLQERFGPEYDRTVGERGARKGEAELAARQRQRDKLEIRPLHPDVRARYAAQWLDLQQRFVDQPAESVAAADNLVDAVMRDRGYPMDDFDTKAGLVSADHPHVVENYRAAREVARANGQHQATTEQLRLGFVHYRALFEELLADDQADADRAGGRGVAGNPYPDQHAGGVTDPATGQHQARPR